jgi:transposase
MGAKRRYYDDEFKQAAIRLVTVNGHGVSETARNLGINAHMLSRWKREDEVKRHNGSTNDGLSSQEKEELSQLRNEVKRLRMEREILKKAAQFFANESN